MDYFKKILEKLKINKNKEDQRFSNLYKMKIMREIELSSPFISDFKLKEENFNEEKIREQLQKIIPEKDHNLIDSIINDKKYYFPNNLTHENGVFRDIDKGNLLDVVNGKKDGFKIPEHIFKTGVTKGLSTMSHNHINGLVIPSKKDMLAIVSYQSKYNPIYSPNKTGFLTNNNVMKNERNWKKITAKYNNLIDNKNLEIEKLYPKKTANIKSNCSGDELKSKLEEDLYRPYFAKNQDNISKEVNKMFKENGFDLKLYIYYKKELMISDNYAK